MNLRIHDPLRQPEHRRRLVALVGSELLADLAEVRPELRLADDGRRPLFGLLGGLMTMAGEATAFDEQMPALLRVACRSAGDIGQRLRGPQPNSALRLIQRLLVVVAELALGDQRGHGVLIVLRRLGAVGLPRLRVGEEGFARRHQIMADRVDLGFGESLLVVRQSRGIVVRQAVEVRHLGVGPEVARRTQPLHREVVVALLGPTIQTRPDLPQIARTIVEIAFDLDPLGRRQILQRRSRFEAHVGPDIAASLAAGDFMAAEAAVLADQVVPAHQLRRFVAMIGADQIGHLMMALEAVRLGEPLLRHREFPVAGVNVVPLEFLLPLLLAEFIVWRVRRPLERSRTALAVVAGRAAELLERMLAGCRPEQFEPRMNGVLIDAGLGQLLVVDLSQLEIARIGDGVGVGQSGQDLPPLFEPLPSIGEAAALFGGRLHQRFESVLGVGGPLDAEVAGHAAVVAGRVLEVVVDAVFVVGDLVNLGRRGVAVDDPEAANPVAPAPFLVDRLLDTCVEFVVELLQMDGFLGEILVEGDQFLVQFLHLGRKGVAHCVGIGELRPEIVDFLHQVLCVVGVWTMMLDRDVVEADLRSERRIQVERNRLGFLLFRQLRGDLGLKRGDLLHYFRLRPFLARLFHGRFRRVHLFFGRNLLDRHPLREFGFDVAEDPLFDFVLAEMILREHHHHRHEHGDAGQREDHVELVLIAEEFIGRSHESASEEAQGQPSLGFGET